MKPKTLINTDQSEAKKNVSDIKIFGEDQWKLLSKASSESQGWMKSTKAMQIDGVGCAVQVTTQQLNDTGKRDLKAHPESPTLKTSVIAESVTFIPGVMIETDYDDNEMAIGRRLVAIPVIATKESAKKPATKKETM